jgi:hypothetical protein
MIQAPQSRSYLAFLLGKNDEKVLVLARSYGVITAIVLDDTESSEETVLRIPTAHIGEFLEPLCDDILVPELTAQYDSIQLLLTVSNQPILGPLSAARAAFLLKEKNCTPAQAVALAAHEGRRITAQHREREKLVDKALSAL